MTSRISVLGSALIIFLSATPSYAAREEGDPWRGKGLRIKNLTTRNLWYRENGGLRCVDFFSAFKGEVFTTEPVLTETLYLLGPSIRAEKACIDFILKGGAVLAPQSAASLSRAVGLMEKYGDVPMDFVDATLVALAEESGVDEIFTLDLKGFHTYRIHGRKAFNVWPK